MEPQRCGGRRQHMAKTWRVANGHLATGGAASGEKDEATAASERASDGQSAASERGAVGAGAERAEGRPVPVPLARYTLSDWKSARCSGVARRLSRAFWSARLCVQSSSTGAPGWRSKSGSVVSACLSRANEKYQARAMLT